MTVLAESRKAVAAAATAITAALLIDAGAVINDSIGRLSSLAQAAVAAAVTALVVWLTPNDPPTP
jgi:hypothetical protein